MKIRNIENTLLPYVEKVFTMNNIEYKVQKTELQSNVIAELSDETFDTYIEDAMCLKQQGDKRTPVISYRRFINGGVKGPYRTLEKDKDKFEAYFNNR